MIKCDDLKAILHNEQLTCVIAHQNRIYKETSNGIAPIMKFLDQHLLENALVADKVIGKAAAMMLVLGNTKELYADIISEHALQWLHNKEIAISYTTCVPYIINRTNDGMCPMETCVLDCEDEQIAKQRIFDKIKELQSK